MRNLVEIRKQLEELIDVPWETKKMSQLLREKLGKVVVPALLGEDEKGSREAKISNRKINSRNNQKTMPGLSNKPIKPTEMPRA